VTLVLSGDSMSGCKKHGPGVWRSDCEECRTAPVPQHETDVILTPSYCNGCKYGSHCLGADPDCACGCE
jgi:hypothetical protein